MSTSVRLTIALRLIKEHTSSSGQEVEPRTWQFNSASASDRQDSSSALLFIRRSSSKTRSFKKVLARRNPRSSHTKKSPIRTQKKLGGRTLLEINQSLRRKGPKVLTWPMSKFKRSKDPPNNRRLICLEKWSTCVSPMTLNSLNNLSQSQRFLDRKMVLPKGSILLSHP